jgi:hypothetical protein
MSATVGFYPEAPKVDAYGAECNDAQQFEAAYVVPVGIKGS